MSFLKRLSRQLVGLLLIAIFLSVASGINAQAISIWFGDLDPDEECELNGGSWEDTGPAEGTCTYPAGNAVATQNCGAGYTYSVTYIEGVLQVDSQTCTLASTSEVTVVYYSSCESRVWGPNPDPVVVYLCFGHNGFVKFMAYVCPQSCLLGFVLPYEAGNDLPDDALATLYVQLDDTDGSPYNGSYTACFENDTGEYLTIYQYITGEWRPLNTSKRGMVCASVSGDGSFYLGPPPS